MMWQQKRKKIGRNDTCPCGSRVKYKRCHGNLKTENKTTFLDDKEINKRIERLKALSIQRRIQQGLGNPIISAELNGFRYVIVANIVHKGQWKTFHEFLVNYLQEIMGREWGNRELQKTFENRHPLLKLYGMMCDYQKTFLKTPGEIHSAPLTGCVSAFLWLSYNLYLIAHNAEIQSRLIMRLQKNDQFAGAYYETYVAAIFIKAGFLLEFENEADGERKHCEFTATHKITQKKYSVEAKFRHRENLISTKGSKNFRVDIGGPFHNALEKEANHQRIIFIDLDLPTSEMLKYSKDKLVKLLKRHEKDLIDGNPAPEAYVFITNHPYHYDLNETGCQTFYFMDGFKIPDFDHKETTLH